MFQAIVNMTSMMILAGNEGLYLHVLPSIGHFSRVQFAAGPKMSLSGGRVVRICEATMISNLLFVNANDERLEMLSYSCMLLGSAWDARFSLCRPV